MNIKSSALLRLLPLVIISAFSLLMKLEFIHQYSVDRSPETLQSLTANASITVTPDADVADDDEDNEEEIFSSRNNSPNIDAETSNSSSNVMVNHSEQENIPNVHAQYESLQMNENSTLADDIINITHVQSESKIIVHFKRNETRYCQQPQLIGRLSGPALSIVSWKQPTTHSLENTTRYDMLVGTYNAPMPGTYFLEIIVTLCVELKYETDAKPLCLVDPHRHRLTKDETTISVNANIDNSSAIGYWYNKATLVDKYDPLYTRYQPQDCSTSPTQCYRAMNLSRFEPYEFKFSTEQMSLQNVVKGKEGKVCIIGSSHSRYLAALLNDTVTSSLDTNLTATMDDDSHYLRFVQSAFTTDEIQKRIDLNCTKVIIGTGQWDAGWPNNYPTSFNDYENYLGIGLERMNNMFRQANIDFYDRETQ
jgi:hypothetical protein